MRSFVAPVFLFVVLPFTACSTTAPDSANSADSADSADTDTAACSEVTSGDDWAWNGACPKMRTPCDIVVTECSFEIDYEADGGMTMGMPYAATVAADVVTFADGDTVTGCVGTVLSSDRIEGTCDGGCAFTLSR